MNKIFASLLLSMAALAASATEIGHDFEIERADAFQPGVTTLADAKEIFGEPASIYAGADGAQTLSWQYTSFGVFSSFKSKNLIIAFDKDGKMLRVALRAVQK